MARKGAAERFEQKRGGRKTRFVLEHGALTYLFEDKDGSGFTRRVAWEDMPPPIDHIEIEEDDAALGWVLMTMPLLALFGVFQGRPQPLGFALAAGVALILVGGAIATKRRRTKRSTTIPTVEGGVIVIGDGQRDAILAAIESRRSAALIANAHVPEHETGRQRLRRLRWLAEQGATSTEAFEEERARLLGPASHRKPQADRALARRVFGESVTFDFRDDHLIHTGRSLFGGARTARVLYRKLITPGTDIYAGTDWRLAIATLGWVGAAVMSWMAYVSQRVPASHYVGGAGLPRALADFGPALLLLVISVVLIERWTKRRYAELYPGLSLIEGPGADEIRDELERRRVEALRRLAEPDPLLYGDERAELFEALQRHGAVDAEERRSLETAGAVAEDEAGLDSPIEAPVPLRARVLH